MNESTFLKLPRKRLKESEKYKTFSPLDRKTREELKRKDKEYFSAFYKSIDEIKNETKITFNDESSQIRAAALQEQLNLIPPNKIASVIKIILAIQKDCCNKINFRNFPLKIAYLNIPGLNSDDFFKNIFYYARHKHFFRYIGRQFFDIKNTSSINKIITILQNKLEEKETFIPNEQKQNLIEADLPWNKQIKENKTLCLEIDPVNFHGTFPSQPGTLCPRSPLGYPIKPVEAV